MPDNIDLKLYGIDTNYLSTVGDAYKIMKGKSLESFQYARNYFDSNTRVVLMGHRQTEIHYLNTLVPITYIGIDINRQSLYTAILAEHYMFDNESNKDIAYLVKPGSKSFSLYERQILYFQQLANSGEQNEM